MMCERHGVGAASFAGQGYTMDEAGMINWMETLLPQFKASGHVEERFRNTGQSAYGWSELDSKSQALCNRG